MKTMFRTATTPQAAMAGTEQVEPTAPARSDDDESTEEDFEATILRLDGATLEWLFRRAGE